MYHAVILCGGSGTRLWPLTRAARPKQFLPLLIDRPLLRETIDRIARTVPINRIWVVTGRTHAEGVRAIAAELDPRNILVEPVPRDSAGAIGLAASRLSRIDPGATFTAFPADHLIRNVSTFDSALRLASALALGRTIVCIGIAPTHPDPGLGYIQRGEPERAAEGLVAYRVDRFVEKPDLARATEFVRDGGYLWNAGVFTWSAAYLRELFAEHVPGSVEIFDRTESLLGIDEAAATSAFASLPRISVDYAILEKAPDRVVVQADLGWLDIGNWDAVFGASPQDAEANAVPTNSVLVDTHRTFVDSRTGRTIALIGVDDLVVVDTADALLICRRDRHQDVRRVVDELRARGLDHLL